MPLPEEWAFIATMIAEEGRTVTLIPTGSLDNAAKPWRGRSDGTGVATVGVLTRYKNSEVDNDTIRRGDQKAFIAPIDGLDIDSVSKLLDSMDSSYWRVVDVQKIEPGSDILLYILQLRR